MPKFPSQEWVDVFVGMLNSNADFAETGKSWEGDIVLVIKKDENFAKTASVYLDLYRGQCRKYEYHEEEGNGTEEGKVPKSEFKYIGSYDDWVRLINKEFDPIQALLSGKFKLEGPLMKMMRYRSAAKAMVNVATMVDSDVLRNKTK